MRIIISGGTGLIGQGVLLQALAHRSVETVVSIGRREVKVSHPKFRQIIHQDFENFAPIANEFTGFDACFWCLGTASAGMDEAAYTRVTYDFTMAAANVLRVQSPDICFCFISGAGTDDTERGLMMWARVKGKTENALKALEFRRLSLFRPGFIQSVRGENPRGAVARVAFATVYPALRAFGAATSNVEIGDAMLAVASGMSAAQILNSRDINRLAAAGGERS